MPLWLGTSGWQYRHWLGRFYPTRPRVADDLAFYAERFRTVELNGTFYKLPDAEVFADWARRTPDDFVFAVKASRFLTHIKRLREPDEPAARLLERARKLGPKLGPVLLQLPPQFHRDEGRLDDALAVFEGVRVAVELRHESWEDRSVRRVLERRGAALCLADRESRLVTPAWRTAEWGYVRFHAGSGAVPGCYGRTALAARARLLASMYGSDADVYVYFNNDLHGCALRDAGWFAREAERAGFVLTRVPSPSGIRVG